MLHVSLIYNMPNKHARKNPYSIKSGITNPYTNETGLMHNAPADNAIHANLHKQNLFKEGYSYPITQNERQRKLVRYKDKDGNIQIRKIYIKSEIEYTVKDFTTNKTIGIQFQDGEFMRASQIEDKGLCVSGLIQMAKKYE